MTWTGRAVSRAGLWTGIILGILVRIPHLRFVPIWDGRQYWDQCVEPALASSFNPVAFNCFGHRSMFYMLAVSWPQYFDQGSALLLNLAHLCLSIAIIVAFHRLAVRLFPPDADSSGGITAAAMTLLFAAMPIWTASSLNLNPDTGVLAGFLFAFAFMLERRLIRSAFAGLFLVLSKEIGLLLWILLALVDIALLVFDRSERTRLRRELVPRALYLLPPLAYLAVGAALRSENMPATWAPAARHPSLVRIFLRLDFADPFFGAYVADLFLLNFAWIMTIILVVWLIAVAVAIFRHRPAPLPPVHDRRAMVFAALVTPATLFLLTRYPTFNNVRYLLPAIPLVVLTFGAAATAMIRRLPARLVIYTVAAVLQLASMWRTLDPVSRYVFGTFRFGDHDLLQMTSRTHECCGYGRDQLVYNLQYTEFDSIQNRLYEVLRPTSDDVFAMARLADWHLQGPLDASTHRRTLRTSGVVRPRVFTLAHVARHDALPDRMRYIAYPNVDNQFDVNAFRIGYRVTGAATVEEHGYRIQVLDLERLKQPQVPAVSR